MTPTSIRICSSFDDPAVASDVWRRLLAAGPTNVVFLDPAWQRTWWECYGGDALLIVVAEQAGKPVAIAPLFALDGMLFLVGSGGLGSDYLDFVGAVCDAELMAAMLAAASERVDGFAGCAFYHVPDASPTGGLLARAAPLLGLERHDEGSTGAPRLDLADREAAREIVDRKGPRQEERRLGRAGAFEVQRVAEPDRILPLLDEFFDQHVARWEAANVRSAFADEAHRRFCRAMVETGAAAGWAALWRLEWQQRNVAFHLSLDFARRHLSYITSRSLDLGALSPGGVLERRVMLHALASGSLVYDFGLGDETYKLNAASEVAHVTSWSLYPP